MRSPRAEHRQGQPLVREEGTFVRRTNGPQGTRRRGGAPRLLIGVALLLVGLAFFLYPTVSALVAQAQIDSALTDLFKTGAAEGVAEVSDTASGENIGHATDAEKAADATYQSLKAYNEMVRTGAAGAVNDPFTFDDSALADLGLPDGIVGKIDIPAMGVTIPLYLGASEAHMADGAGVVAGTSAPLGETDSNCVIAAHRGGYHGLAMFRDIEKLAPGDTITITTPWDTLTYAVTETRVIEPDEVDAVGVQEGRDLVTLLTCHPYGTNRYRMLVFCERTDAPAAESSFVSDVITQFTPDLTSSSPLLTVEGVLKLLGVLILVALGVTLVVQTVRARLRRPDEQPPGPRGLHFKS